MPRLIILLSCLLLTSTLFSATNKDDSRTLKFFHTHTGKSLEVTYFKGGLYLLEPMEALRDFLADWRTGEKQYMDPELMDFLWEIQRVTGNKRTFEVISAYRSEKNQPGIA